MTKLQTREHKLGNAMRRERIGKLMTTGDKADRSYYAKSIGIGQAGRFSTTRNFCPPKPKAAQ